MAGYDIIYDKAHWDSVIARLAEAEVGAKERFQAALDEAAGPIVAEVQAAALGLASHGTKHTGLRGRLAAGVSVNPDSSGDAAIRIEASEGLSRVTDNGASGWRHPVYGNMNNWVHQDGGSWFKDVIQNDEGQIENRLQQALEQLANSID